MFGQGWTGTRQTLMKKQCVLMDEPQRHELCEAPCFVLDVAKHQDLVQPVLGCFHVPIHQGRRRTDAQPMCSRNHFPPLRGRKLVAGENRSYFIIQNLGSGSGESVEPIVTQHLQIVRQRHAREFDSIHYLHGRKRMTVHLRDCYLHRPENVAIIKRR